MCRLLLCGRILMKRSESDINWDQVEPRIRPHVEFLRSKGFNTASSCGHQMTIDVAVDPTGVFAGTPRTIADIYTCLVDAGYEFFELTYVIDASPGRDRQYVRVKFLGDLTGDGQPFKVVLLKITPDLAPLYLVVRHRIYPPENDPFDLYRGVSDDEADAYLYEEHTCPTNWTNDILSIISDDDEDPHGIVEWIASKPAPPGLRWSGEVVSQSSDELIPVAADSATYWHTVFPELNQETKDEV